MQGQVPGTNVTKCSWNSCRASCGSLFVLVSNKVPSHPDMGYVIISIGESRARIWVLVSPRPPCILARYFSVLKKRFHLVSPQSVLWQLSSTPLSDECQATAVVSGWGGSCMLCLLSCLPLPFNFNLEILIRFQIRPKILNPMGSYAPRTKTVI